MANARLVSRRLSTSRKFNALADGDAGEFAQVLYVLLIAHADDFGRLDGDPWTVKHAVVPASRRSVDSVQKAMHALAGVGLVTLYDVDGQKVCQVNDFDAHQQGLHRRTASRFPELPGTSGNFQEFPSEQNRTEQKGTEQKRSDRSAGADDGFDDFWDNYPRKVAKPAAKKAWKALRPDAALFAAIRLGVERHRKTENWTKDGGKYIPHPDTFLNGRRWEDELPAPTTSSIRPPDDADAYGWCQHEPRCGTRAGHDLKLQREAS